MTLFVKRTFMRFRRITRPGSDDRPGPSDTMLKDIVCR